MPSFRRTRTLNGRLSVGGVVAVACCLLTAAPLAGAAAHGDLSGRVIQVGALTDNYPFSFRGRDGEVEGFAVDLLAAVAARMSLKIAIVPGPTNEINGAFREGRLDLLQSFAQSREREVFADFSSPYLSMVGAVFIRQGVRGIGSLSDLNGLKVAVHRGSLGEQVLRAYGLDASIVIVPSVEAALEGVDRGEYDATLATRLTALATADHLGLRKVRAADVQVPGFLVRYCFAVQEGDADLLAALNEGLLILERNGDLERIYRRWFGRVDPRKYSAFHVLSAVAAGLAVALSIALWAVVRQRRLRHRIGRQAGLLRASEERYRGLFEGAPGGLVLFATTPEGLVLEDANPAATRLLGWAEKPRHGLPIQDVLLPDDAELCRRIGEAYAAGSNLDVELPRSGLRGAAWLHVSTALIGRTLQVALSDETAARAAEERLRRQEEQIQQNQKLEAIGTLAGGIAHDFNNILTSIIGNAELIRLDTPKESPLTEALDAVLAASMRAKALVRQILAFSRRSGSRWEPLDPTPVMQETVEFLRAIAPASVEIRLRPPAGPVQIMGDPTQLHQVLMNLGTNGIQAMRGGEGVLEITADRLTAGTEVTDMHPELKPGEYLRICVRDTGCGMTPEARQRIFEPFFTTKAPGEGTGLGLAVAHGIVKTHGGTITVYSRPGEGTRFHLFFPLVDRAEPVLPDAARRSTLEGAGEHVLLLDDEPPITATFGRVLTRLGYRVSTYNIPAEAIEAIAAPGASFAVIITDLAMPRMSGLAVVERVKALRPGVPIILTSGFVGDAEAQRARELGVVRIIEKPLTAEDIAEAVASCLGRASG